MEPMPKMSREEYLVVMRQKMEAMLGQVADAINDAPDGYIIADSEEKVRDLFADLRQQAFELGFADASRCGGKPLFPPPKHSLTGKNLRNKGRQEYSVLTINGRVWLRRIRWHGAGDGSYTPLDVYLDKAEQTISVGAREIGCRLNSDGKNFDKGGREPGAGRRRFTPAAKRCV